LFLFWSLKNHMRVGPLVVAGNVLLCVFGLSLLFAAPKLSFWLQPPSVHPGEAKAASLGPPPAASTAPRPPAAFVPVSLESRRSAPAAPAAVAPEQAGVHLAKAGESVAAVARAYLPVTSFMTVAELESAIRRENGIQANFLKKGQQVTIPGLLRERIVERPVPVPRDLEVRAIYVTGLMATSPHGIELIRRWRQVGGNAVVFDIKDSDGSLSIGEPEVPESVTALLASPFAHPLATVRRHPPIGSLPKFARFLHSQGMHAIARIAIFRDEQLVTHHPELAVRSRRTGQPWRENGKLVWTDPSRPEVQDYNIALARYAAASGADEVQFDYVRFPAEGDQADAQFAFQTEHPDSHPNKAKPASLGTPWKRSDVIAHFLDRAYAEMQREGVLFSLDVFGVMAWQRPIDLAHTGQDIVAMARRCDVLSPMIYPSHFFGMDGYAHPGDAPQHFISESMMKFGEITKGSGVVLRPWLQAFAWQTKSYSTQYILTQVSVAKENGGIGFLFWNARNDYKQPLLAMPEMARAHERYFRGDEVGHPAPAKVGKAIASQHRAN
jgi:hypothetical protein